MKSNTMIRTLTLTFIVFCFIAMFVLASFSSPADGRMPQTETGMIELSGNAGQTAQQFDAVHLFSESVSAEDTPSM